METLKTDKVLKENLKIGKIEKNMILVLKIGKIEKNIILVREAKTE